jgi:hypothetical protein
MKIPSASSGGSYNEKSIMGTRPANPRLLVNYVHAASLPQAASVSAGGQLRGLSHILAFSA